MHKLPLMLLLVAGLAAADDNCEVNHQQFAEVPLVEVLDRASTVTQKNFAIGRDVRPMIVAGHYSEAELDYASLLTILRNNGLTLVEAGGLATVVAEDRVRQHALPVLDGPDADRHADEWVTMSLTVEHVSPGQLVPILRPLLPAQGHLAAHPASNTIVIVDRYANVMRVVELIRRMDVAVPEQEPRSN